MENFVADAIYIDAPPERVFSALIDPEEVVVWAEGEEATIAAGEGGRYAIRRADGSSAEGVIAVFRPGERLEIAGYRLEAPGEHRGPMQLTFSIEPRDGGSWLVVRQDDLDQGSGDAAGWKEFARRTRRELVRATVSLKRHIEQI
jgi:uncharacterized protein YndB with AHSA1/START domain